MSTVSIVANGFGLPLREFLVILLPHRCELIRVLGLFGEVSQLERVSCRLAVATNSLATEVIRKQKYDVRTGVGGSRQGIAHLWLPVLLSLCGASRAAEQHNPKYRPLGCSHMPPPHFGSRSI